MTTGPCRNNEDHGHSPGHDHSKGVVDHKLNLHHDRKKHHTKKMLHVDGGGSVVEGAGSPGVGGIVDDAEYNIFRDSLLRYLGYANELGESFRYQFPKLVKPSYMVAFGYCLADATTSGYRAYNNSTIKTDASDDARAVVDATVASVDTLLWQSMASVAIPGFVIHQIVKWSRFGIQKIASASISPHKHRPRIMMMTTWGPTMLGLASIPLIIKPIDMFVDEVMENTFRTYVIPDNNSSCNNSSGGNKEN